jgi:hypothetical protein
MVTMCKQFCEHSKVIQRDQAVFLNLGILRVFPVEMLEIQLRLLDYEAIQQKHESYATEMKHRPVTETHGTWWPWELHSPMGFVLRLSMQNRDIEANRVAKWRQKNIQKLRYDKIRSDTIRISILQLFQQGIARYEVCLRLR